MNGEDKAVLERFALDHKCVLEEKGEVGFGRGCVGFTKGNGYIDYARLDDQTYMPMEGWSDERLQPPDGVDDAYHKHDCLAVLVSPSADDPEGYEGALTQLVIWVRHLNKLGVEVAEWERQHKHPVEMMMHGSTGYCLKVKAA